MLPTDTEIEPELPLDAAPVFTRRYPTDPFAVAPVEIVIAPEFPTVLELPVDSDAEPLVPLTDMSPLPIEIAPELPVTTLPEFKVTDPLVPVEELPEYIDNAPLPVPAVPELSTTDPEVAVKEEPEATVTAPVRPLLAVPELSTISPVLPTEIEFALRIIIIPELELCPAPDVTNTAPPDAVVKRVFPADTSTLPPLPLNDCPAENTSPPPVAYVVSPTNSEIPPARPDDAMPV